jgi:hypothetical protein
MKIFVAWIGQSSDGLLMTGNTAFTIPAGQNWRTEESLAVLVNEVWKANSQVCVQAAIVNVIELDEDRASEFPLVEGVRIEEAAKRAYVADSGGEVRWGALDEDTRDMWRRIARAVLDV